MDFVDRGRLFDAFRRHGHLVAPGGDEDARQARPATQGQALIPGRPENRLCHRFGTADAVDWLGGRVAGVRHAA